jgi:uncharacterized protein (DUF58 family)
MRFRITTEQRIVLALLGFCLLGGIITGSQLYFRMSYVWMLFFVGNWVWSFYSLRGVGISRKARTVRAQLGQVFEERFELHNYSLLPRMWLEVRDESTIPGLRTSQVFTQIGGREGRSYVAHTRLGRRGVFPLGPTVVYSGDLFGLFPQKHSFEAHDTLLVYPMVVEVKAFSNPVGPLPGGDSLRRRTHQVTPNAAGVREYAPGDSFNRIHWLSTARRNRLMVKEFELDPQSDIWILLDAERVVHASLPWTTYSNVGDLLERSRKIKLPPSTEEYAASIAASLARYYLRNKRAVGLISHGEPRTMLPPDRGGRQLVKILESLALWKANGGLQLLGMVESQAPHLPRGSMVILVTPSPRDEIVLATDYLTRRGLRPVVVLINLVTFGGALSVDAVGKHLKVLRVPVCQVANGDDLQVALSSL